MRAAEEGRGRGEGEKGEEVFFSSRRRHTRYSTVSWARGCVEETGVCRGAERPPGVCVCVCAQALDDPRVCVCVCVPRLWTTPACVCVCACPGTGRPSLLYISDAADEEDSLAHCTLCHLHNKSSLIPLLRSCPLLTRHLPTTPSPSTHTTTPLTQ